MLITKIYNLADTCFVGTLGESRQAATGILFTLQAIIQAIAFMLGHGSGTFVSKLLSNVITGLLSIPFTVYFMKKAPADVVETGQQPKISDAANT